MIWRELIAAGAESLKAANVEDASANAEYLALSVLKLWHRSELLDKLTQPVAGGDEQEFLRRIGQRRKHEPLQYIIGEWEFFGLRLLTPPGALIPRPETEILVEESLHEAAEMTAPIRILDIGTGTAAIPLALAARLPDAVVHAIDISSDALQIAKQNAERLNLRVRFTQADVFEEDWLADHLGKVDLLVSNPPYVSLEEWETLEEELRLHEPRIALTDNADGLSFYRSILNIAPRLMSERGRVLLELGYSASTSVEGIAALAGIETLRIVPDLAGIPRVFVGCAKRLAE